MDVTQRLTIVAQELMVTPAELSRMVAAADAAGLPVNACEVLATLSRGESLVGPLQPLRRTDRSRRRKRP